MASLTFWPLRRPYPTVVNGYSGLARPLGFSPDGHWLATGWSDSGLRLWPVGKGMEAGPRVQEVPGMRGWTDLAFTPDGRHIFVVGTSGRTYVIPLDGSSPRRLEGFGDGTLLWSAAVSPSGRQVAAAYYFGQGEKLLLVWDLETGATRRFELPEVPGRTEGVLSVAFADETTLFTAGVGGIHRWHLDDATHELILAAKPNHEILLRLATGGHTALTTQYHLQNAGECYPAELADLRAGTARPLPEFGDCVYQYAIALDASGTIAGTGGLRDGLVRVGRLDGGEPHILAGHKGAVNFVAISPDLRWVASTGEDNTLRLWPMPDLDAPPLHTLPREELLAKLHSLTNLRAIRDPEAPDGWEIDLGPFPGWKHVPSW